MTASLNGTWILETSENFDEFMKELGVNVILRKVGNTLKPTLIITSEGDKWSIKMRSSFKNTEDKFVIGEEYDDETTDGRKCRTLFTIDGDKLVCHQKDRKTGALQVVGIRYIDADGKMVEDLDCNNVKCKRIFKRVE